MIGVLETKTREMENRESAFAIMSMSSGSSLDAGVAAPAIFDIVRNDMNLQPPKVDGNRFCGPAVISAIAGIGTKEAARRIRERTGRRNVMGTYPYELKGVLSDLGFSLWPVDSWERGERPTLAAWLKSAKGTRTAGRIFLVISGNHWQLVSGRRYTCGVVREVISIRDKMVKRRARVEAVWEVVKGNIYSH